MTNVNHLDGRPRTVHFTGDSVTDCGRRTVEDGPLGDGYVSRLAKRTEFETVTVINSGINGNRTRELSSRWQADVLATEPDVLSVLVGINDTWRRYDSSDPTPIAEFTQRYAGMLSSARSAGVGTLVVCEPFVLPINEDQRRWREDLDPKIEAVRRLARDFDAVLVPLDAALAELAKRLGIVTVAPDGVHPTPVAHAAIARLWWQCAGHHFDPC